MAGVFGSGAYTCKAKKMARNRSLIKLEGTIGATTFVNSKRYKPHARSRRGTYKEARVNAVLHSQSTIAKAITATGSPILKQLKAVESGFASADLWQRMMALMLKTRCTDKAKLLDAVQGLELNERYSFSKFFAAMPSLSFSVKKSKLLVEMKLLSHAEVDSSRTPACYLCEVNILFLHANGKCEMDVIETEWISLEESPGAYDMVFEIPAGAKYFLVVLGVKAGADNTAFERFDARGYRISDWGKC